MKETYKTLKHYPKLSQYLKGDIIDIGCGKSPVTNTCDKFDMEQGDANTISNYVQKNMMLFFQVTH